VRLEQNSYTTTVPKNLLEILDYRFGILLRGWIDSLDYDEPDLFFSSVDVSNIGRVANLSIKGNMRTSGVGCSIPDAIVRAIAEGIERYCTIFAQKFYDIKISTYERLKKQGKKAIDPDSLPLFSQAQYEQENFPFEQFTESTKVGWVKGLRLTDGQGIYVPAQLIFSDYKRRKNERLVGYSTSSGCATDKSLFGALLKGIYEQIERDSLVVLWYSRIPPKKLDISKSKTLSEFFDQRMRKPNLEYHFLDARLDISIPTVLCVSIDKRNSELTAAIGASTNLNPEKATKKALMETAQVRRTLKASLYLHPKPIIDSKKVRDLDSVARFYGHRDNIHFMEFLWGSGETVKLEMIPNNDEKREGKNLKKVIEILFMKNLSPIAFNLTTPDVQELGLYVTRVFIPQLAQFANPMYPFLANRRIYEVQKIINEKVCLERKIDPATLPPLPLP